MLTEADWQTIERAKKAGCEIPASSVQPPGYWLEVAREFLECFMCYEDATVEFDGVLYCKQHDPTRHLAYYVRELLERAGRLRRLDGERVTLGSVALTTS